jgi:hypothetical protein
VPPELWVPPGLRTGLNIGQIFCYSPQIGAISGPFRAPIETDNPALSVVRIRGQFGGEERGSLRPNAALNRMPR